MGRPRKTESTKILEQKKFEKEIGEQIAIIVENAKLLSTGKLRNTFFLEKAARELTRLEEQSAKSNN